MSKRRAAGFGCMIPFNIANPHRRRADPVKRAGKSRAGNWQLVSDNPDKREWPTLRWPANAEIIGQVKWAPRPWPRDAAALGQVMWTGRTL